MLTTIKTLHQGDAYSMVVPYNIIIQRYYSDEELEKNRKINASFMESGDYAWKQHCERVQKMFSEKVDKFLDVIERQFSIGQLHDRGGKYPNYDLWFWCREEDHSYITLSFIKHYKGINTEKIREDVERINDIYNRITNILESYEETNLCATIQFGTIELPQEIEKAARKKAVELDGKCIKIDGMIGKFWMDEQGRYLFKRKYAKKAIYSVEPKAVLRCSIIK